MRILFLLLFICSTCFSQEIQNESPYHTDWLKDGVWVGAGVGLNVLGLHLIQNKDALTDEEISNLSKDDVFFMDRWSAGYSSDRADEISYIPFYASFATPVALALLNKNERNHAGQIMVLFVETMATTGALFTISAGAVERSRPLVYDTSLPIGDRKDKDAQRSFFAGHTAATAAATFFAAKVFQDFNPESSWVPYVWAGAAAVPAYVGYLRIKAGKHFLSDSIIGYGVGALSGILIPQIHKKKDPNLSLSPTMGNIMGQEYSGIHLSYQF